MRKSGLSGQERATATATAAASNAGRTDAGHARVFELHSGMLCISAGAWRVARRGDL